MIPQEQWLTNQREWLAAQEKMIIALLSEQAVKAGILGPREQISFSLEIVGVADVIPCNEHNVLDFPVEEFFSRQRLMGIGVNRNVAIWTVNQIRLEQRKREDAGNKSFTVRDFLECYTHSNLIKRFGFNDETVKAICSMLELYGQHLKHY